ncbi:unnamed protein product [Vitrella brassicaformis CCMP3155]|uniref:Uncharacterized protein n=2 Tax=Vitrella brassicaformis TaxID=1169539 RepID=A0A0G4FED2_VITBC|nr:unnamed protein product [Vitrella brassicaformis CCMP3155]|eukprot:CEM11572.1 unnamed protein product [Vitrella brassicaformis CCMP3155]
MEHPDLSDFSLSVESAKVIDVLTKLINNQKLLSEQNADLESRLKELASKSDEAAEKLRGLEEENGRKTAQIDELQGKVRALEDLDPSAVVEKLKGHDESLKAALEKVDGFDVQLKERSREFAEQCGEVRKALDKTREVAGKMDSVERKFNDMATRMKDTADKADKALQKVVDVSDAQAALQTDVDMKYERLWTEVLKTLENLNITEVKNLKDTIQKQNAEAERRMQNMVSYCLGVLAKASTDRSNVQFKRKMLHGWREATWLASRRRMGIALLHRLFNRRKRDVLARWRTEHRLGAHADGLDKSYAEKLMKTQKTIADNIDPQMQDIKDRLDGLDKSKVSLERMNTSLEERERNWDQKLATLQDVKNETDEIRELLQEVTASSGKTAEAKEGLMGRLIAAEQALADMKESIPEFAKESEIKDLMKDMLLIWNSLKQLDVAKADKKELDSYAVEAGDRDKETQGRLDGLEGNIAAAQAESQSQLSGVGTRLRDVEGAAQNTDNRLRTLNHMLSSLLHFVEEILWRFSNQRIGEGGEIPPPPKVVRTGGGFREYPRQPPPPPTPPPVPFTPPPSLATRPVLSQPTGFSEDTHFPSAPQWPSTSSPRTFDPSQDPASQTLNQWIQDARDVLDMAATPTPDPSRGSPSPGRIGTTARAPAGSHTTPRIRSWAPGGSVLGSPATVGGTTTPARPFHPPGNTRPLTRPTSARAGGGFVANGGTGERQLPPHHNLRSLRRADESRQQQGGGEEGNGKEREREGAAGVAVVGQRVGKAVSRSIPAGQWSRTVNVPVPQPTPVEDPATSSTAPAAASRNATPGPRRRSRTEGANGDIAE